LICRWYAREEETLTQATSQAIQNYLLQVHLASYQ
jgi:hypothetical protein